MHAEAAVHRDGDLHHTAGGHVADQREGCEGAGAEAFVAVDDVLVAADEDAQDAVAEEHRGSERRPHRDGRVRRPRHPEHGDGNGWRAEHAEPEPEFRWEAVAAGGLDAGEVLARPDVDERHEEGGAAEAEGDTEEGEAGQTLGEAVGFGEDKGVPVQEGEEHDVDDGEVEGEEYDDGFADRQQKGAVQGLADAGEEGFLTDLDFGAVARFRGELAEMGSFPF